MDEENKETIVDNQSIREAMSVKVKDIYKEIGGSKLNPVYDVVGILGSIWLFHSLNLSWWFIGFTELVLLTIIIFNRIACRNIKQPHLMDENLMEVSHKILRMKKIIVRMHFINIPFIIIWFSWFATELIMNSDDPLSILLPCIAGVIVGEIYGIRSYRRACRSANDIVRQINELSE